MYGKWWDLLYSLRRKWHRNGSRKLCLRRLYTVRRISKWHCYRSCCPPNCFQRPVSTLFQSTNQTPIKRLDTAPVAFEVIQLPLGQRPAAGHVEDNNNNNETARGYIINRGFPIINKKILFISFLFSFLEYPR